MGVKLILSIAGGWIPQSLLIPITRQSFIFPFYHTVSNVPLPHVNQVYQVRSYVRFMRDLDFLTRHFMPVGLEELRKLRETGKAPSKPSMFLSFDDGLSGVYDFVAPELKRRGIPAAFFVNADFIDNRDLFYRYKASLIIDRLEKINYSPAVLESFHRHYDLDRADRKSVRDLVLGVNYHNRSELDEMAKLLDLDFASFLKVKEPYMTTEQIRELADMGFYIGSHSKDHPPFSALKHVEQLAQYRDSLSMIRQKFGLSYGLFSFPFADDGVSMSFFAALSGKAMPVLDASFGTAGLKRDPVTFHFQRIPMEMNSLPGPLIIKGEFTYYLLKGPFGRNVINRK